MSKGRRSKTRQGQSSATSQRNSQQIAQATTREFIGPISPPAMLEEYNRVVTGAAERIMVMAEKEASHRHGVEQLIITNE